MQSKFLSLSVVLTGLVLVYFGLRPKGYRLLNQVESIDGGSGLALGAQGIAFSQTPDSKSGNPLSDGELTLNFFFEPELSSSSYLMYLVSLWSDSHNEFVSVCQWRDQILIMRHHKHSINKAPMLGFRINSKSSGMLTITSDCSEGTLLYLNGVLVDSSKTLRLTCGNPAPERISLGNSPRGNRGWKGKLWAFSLLDSSLSAAEVAALADGMQIMKPMKSRTQISERPNQSPDIPVSLIPFFQAPAYFGQLQTPKWMQAPYREILISPWDNNFNPDSYAVDMLLNFLAFLPWGFLWTLLLSRRGYPPLGSLTLAVFAAVLLSFIFEAVQYFIPTRTSQLIDLLLNGAGGLLGSGIALLWRRFSQINKVC